MTAFPSVLLSSILRMYSSFALETEPKKNNTARYTVYFEISKENKCQIITTPHFFYFLKFWFEKWKKKRTFSIILVFQEWFILHVIQFWILRIYLTINNYIIHIHILRKLNHSFEKNKCKPLKIPPCMIRCNMCAKIVDQICFL